MNERKNQSGRAGQQQGRQQAGQQSQSNRQPQQGQDKGLVQPGSSLQQNQQNPSDWATSQGGQASQEGGRQQQQFDSQARGQQGGGGQAGSFADQIRQHAEVIDDSGNHVGTVDHLDGDRIKLAKSDSSAGHHQYVPLSQVAGIEGGKVRLRARGDNDFGVEAGN